MLFPHTCAGKRVCVCVCVCVCTYNVARRVGFQVLQAGQISDIGFQMKQWIIWLWYVLWPQRDNYNYSGTPL